MDYEKLLDKGRKQLPESVLKRERFEVPKVRGHIQGNKTILSNFSQIAGDLRREPSQLLKFILKELATPGEIKAKAVIIGRKVSAKSINEKISKYVEEFVLCPECKKPDTKLTKENNINFIKCMACGARHTIKRKI